MSYSNLQTIIKSKDDLVDKIDELNELNRQLKDSGDYDLRTQVLAQLIPMSQEYLTTTVNANIKRFRVNKIKEYEAELVEIHKDKQLLESLLSDPKNRSRTLSTLPGDPENHTVELSPYEQKLNAAVWPYNAYGRVKGGTRTKKSRRKTRRTRR